MTASNTKFSSWPVGGIDTVLTTLQETYIPNLQNIDMAGLLNAEALGKIAIVSSFGAESAVLLHYVTSLNPDIPILFLDTQKHFDETVEYRKHLTELLDLDVIVIKPDAAHLSAEDPDGDLFKHDPNACCLIRKTFSLQDALEPFDTWISGRKRYQSTSRANIPFIERDGEKIKLNPMAIWSKQEVEQYFEEHKLPKHPLEARGYLSIGCAPCTRPVIKGEDPRAGRWAQTPGKTECGIHLGPDGKFTRQGA